MAIATVRWELKITEALLRRVQRRYHYEEMDLALMRQVAEDMERAMKDQVLCRWCAVPGQEEPAGQEELPERTELSGQEEPVGKAGLPERTELPRQAEPPERTELPGEAEPVDQTEQQAELAELEKQAGRNALLEVVITLGQGLDALQEAYLQQQMLLEAYMVETIGGELLLTCYEMFNREAADETGRHVARYHFFGGEPDLLLEQMRDALVRTEATEVTYNEAFCLIPRMSVVFRAELTEDASQVCEGICTGCGNRRCPNRLEERPENGEYKMRWPDLSTQVLPYGYRKIFGLDASARID